MQYKGINYDTGTRTTTGSITREVFDLNVIEEEINIIKNELHCNSVRICGFDITRVSKTSEIALSKGLIVWYSPSLQYDNAENTYKYIIENAKAAAELYKVSPDIVFVIAGELSLFTNGFVRGETGMDRIENMFSPLSLVKNMLGIPRKYNKRINRFLVEAVAGTRKYFPGKITYASGTWEQIDWSIFDIVGVDFYRSSFNQSVYKKQLGEYLLENKPVAIMEFGCSTFKGAAEKGGMGWAIVDWSKPRPAIKGKYECDEQSQEKYLMELLEIFDRANIYAAFVFTFISANYIFKEDPAFNLDLAAYGIVKSLGHDKPGYKNLHWIPKKAYFSIASFYSTH